MYIFDEFREKKFTKNSQKKFTKKPILTITVERKLKKKNCTDFLKEKSIYRFLRKYNKKDSKPMNVIPSESLERVS